MSPAKRSTTRMPRGNRRKPGVDPGVRTARNSRRLIHTGTVDEVRALFPPRPAGQAAANDVGATTPRAGATDRPEETFRRIYSRIADRDVLTARAHIKASGVVEFLEHRSPTRRTALAHEYG